LNTQNDLIRAMQTRLYTPDDISEGLIYGDYAIRFLALQIEEKRTVNVVFAHSEGFFPVKPEHAPSIHDLFDTYGSGGRDEDIEIVSFSAKELLATLPAPVVAAPPEAKPITAATDPLHAEIQEAIKNGDTVRLGELYTKLVSSRKAPQEITDESLVMLPSAALEESAEAEKFLVVRPSGLTQ
jgi:hypothetical protein